MSRRVASALKRACQHAAAAPARAAQRRADRESRQRKAAHYSGMVGPGDVVFDIGANLGEFTAVFRALGARVVAVEPQPVCVDALTKRYRRDREVSIVSAAVSDAPGVRTLHLNRSHVLSSLSEEWISATERSGRFARWSEWTGETEVEVRTLDSLVEEFGTPRFCKVDVEGHEVEVFDGLTRPLELVSFEFTAEVADRAIACAQRLTALGAREFNLSHAEDARLQEEWVGLEAISRRLAASDDRAWGDVYVRF